MTLTETKQKELCERYGAEFMPPSSLLKVGIANDVGSGILPINGLRHPPTEDATGWYIWAGNEPKGDPEYFRPLHVEHLDEYHPRIIEYLALAPGWRFQIAPGHEDVWFDESLLLES